ncbi:hypothetical protein Q1695_013034 [Nippostrongylus brasiliensis]|nr:hypothetical protein Q1695_013034 [Nippostrongylus brasiliensis]
MKYLLLFLIVAGILPGTFQTTVYYERKNGDKVIHTVYNKTTTWIKAEFECNSIGAHLGYFEDLAEMQTVLGEFELTDCPLIKGLCEGVVWMGAQRKHETIDYNWLFEPEEPYVSIDQFPIRERNTDVNFCLVASIPLFRYGDLRCVSPLREETVGNGVLGFVCTKKA